MKIRPLKKIVPGDYESRDGNWRFIENRDLSNAKRNNPEAREWWAYQKQIDGKFYSDTTYFFESYPTLKSLVKALEKAKP